jgi:hypothetical protein
MLDQCRLDMEGDWAERYNASQAQEFTDHVICDMSKLIPNKKTGKLEPAHAPATVNRSLAYAKKDCSWHGANASFLKITACGSITWPSTTSARYFSRLSK